MKSAASKINTCWGRYQGDMFRLFFGGAQWMVSLVIVGLLGNVWENWQIKFILDLKKGGRGGGDFSESQIVSSNNSQENWRNTKFIKINL